MSGSSAWIGVVGALCGVAITSMVGFGTAMLTHRWNSTERNQERELAHQSETAALRRAAYSRYLVAADSFQTATSEVLEDPDWRAAHSRESVAVFITSLRASAPAVWDAREAAKRDAQLLAGETVQDALQTYNDSLNAFIAELATTRTRTRSNDLKEHEAALLAAMRSELQA